MKYVTPRIGKKGTTYRVRVGDHYIGTFRDVTIADAREAEFLANRQMRRGRRGLGCVWRQRGRWYASVKIAGRRFRRFGGHASAFEARKALEAGLVRIGGII